MLVYGFVWTHCWTVSHSSSGFCFGVLSGAAIAMRKTMPIAVFAVCTVCSFLNRGSRLSPQSCDGRCVRSNSIRSPLFCFFRRGYDGDRRRKGQKIYILILDTLYFRAVICLLRGFMVAVGSPPETRARHFVSIR